MPCTTPVAIPLNVPGTQAPSFLTFLQTWSSESKEAYSNLTKGSQADSAYVPAIAGLCMAGPPLRVHKVNVMRLVAVIQRIYRKYGSSLDSEDFRQTLFTALVDSVFPDLMNDYGCPTVIVPAKDLKIAVDADMLQCHLVLKVLPSGPATGSHPVDVDVRKAFLLYRATHLHCMTDSSVALCLLAEWCNRVGAQYVRCAINYGEQWLFAVYEAPTYGSRPVFRRSDIMTFSHDDFQDLLGTILNLTQLSQSPDHTPLVIGERLVFKELAVRERARARGARLYAEHEGRAEQARECLSAANSAIAARIWYRSPFTTLQAVIHDSLLHMTNSDDCRWRHVLWDDVITVPAPTPPGGEHHIYVQLPIAHSKGWRRGRLQGMRHVILDCKVLHVFEVSSVSELPELYPIAARRVDIWCSTAQKDHGRAVLLCDNYWVFLACERVTQDGQCKTRYRTTEPMNFGPRDLELTVGILLDWVENGSSRTSEFFNLS